MSPCTLHYKVSCARFTDSAQKGAVAGLRSHSWKCSHTSNPDLWFILSAESPHCLEAQKTLATGL